MFAVRWCLYSNPEFRRRSPWAAGDWRRQPEPTTGPHNSVIQPAQRTTAYKTIHKRHFILSKRAALFRKVVLLLSHRPSVMSSPTDRSAEPAAWVEGWDPMGWNTEGIVQEFVLHCTSPPFPAIEIAQVPQGDALSPGYGLDDQRRQGVNSCQGLRIRDAGFPSDGSCHPVFLHSSIRLCDKDKPRAMNNILHSKPLNSIIESQA
jgi:hypothetical protein